jgi:predicted nucleic acid-binding protein
MAFLLDTNILLRSVQSNHPMHGAALAAFAALANAKERVTIVPQVIVEFWTVATRPIANNGLGLTPKEAEAEMVKILGAFELLPETPALFDEWKKLVVAHGVSGVETHDARVVAAMKVHGLSRILTFNEHDFDRYKGIVTVVTPSILLAQGGSGTSS